MAEEAVNGIRHPGVYDWLKNSLNGLFPPTCQLCGAAGHGGRDLCPGCLLDLPWLLGRCSCCALPLPTADLLCGRCLRRPPPFQRVVAPFVYATPIDRLIHGFKFRNDLPCGRLLADLLAEHVEQQEELPELLLPVPLHPLRLRERGFNQAWELTRPLAKRLGVPADRGLLARVRHTPAQHELLSKQRRGNVRGAFAVTGSLQARHVAIVDDVLTTGHTAAELARILRRAGAERVDVWVLARTGRP